MVKLPKQDFEASKASKAQKVLVMPFVTHNQATKLLQPGKQPLTLPTALVASEGTPIMSRRTLAVPAVWSNQRNALHGQQLVQRVTVISAVANQSLRHVFDEAGSKDRFNELALMR